jgi:acetyl esterase
VTLWRPAFALGLNVLFGAACAGQAQMPCPAIDLPAPGGAHLLPGTRIGIEYARRGAQRLTFDLFRHDDTVERPTAVVLRGGAGQSTVGARLSFVGQLVETLAEAGYQVVLPDYRATSRADTESDLVALFQSLRCHGGALGVNPDRVVLVGEDSGGDAALRLTAHLASLRRGRTARWPAPARATVAVGATYADVPTAIEDQTLLVHGGADRQPSVERPRAVCATATEPSRCAVLEVEGASHRAENWWPSQWAYKARMVEWLGRHVGPVPPAAWPDDPRLRKRVVFDAAAGLTLDAYVPEGAGPFAAAILVHGGGWEAGDRVTYIAPMFQPLAARSIAWFSIDYRLTPQVDNPTQMQDVIRALEYVRTHAPAYRVDPRRLVLVGESASGQLVSHLATRGVDVAGVVSFYGVYDFLAMSGDTSSPRWLGRRLFGLTQLDDVARATLREYSPQYHVRQAMPPLLLVTGTADGLYAQAQAFEAALRASGARFDSLALPDAPHGMENWHADPRWRAWSGQVVAWIERVTRR